AVVVAVPIDEQRLDERSGRVERCGASWERLVTLIHTPAEVCETRPSAWQIVDFLAQVPTDVADVEVAGLVKGEAPWVTQAVTDDGGVRIRSIRIEAYKFAAKRLEVLGVAVWIDQGRA